MSQVLLVPGNPLDIRAEDLQPLVEQIKSGNDLTVEVRAVSQRGYAVTWWEVLNVYLIQPGEGAVVALLVADIIKKVRRWYRNRRAERGNKRPLSLTFRDKEGVELRRVEMHPTGTEEPDKPVQRKKVPSKSVQKKSKTKVRSTQPNKSARTKRTKARRRS